MTILAGSKSTGRGATDSDTGQEGTVHQQRPNKGKGRRGREVGEKRKNMMDGGITKHLPPLSWLM